MAKLIPDAILDLMLDQAEGTLLCVCSTQPTTYTQATDTYKLADVVIDSGDYTAANGDTSGRKNTIGAQSAVTIDTSGTAEHVAVVTTGDTTLRLVTTCTSQVLTAGGTVDIGSFAHELLDVTP
jgi:hypothetical protein